jgi:TM2 domain-containing membrane protein YozV
MALIKCNECGNEVSDKAASCPKCGAPPLGVVASNHQKQPLAAVVVQTPKSRAFAILLALFLGGLGIHKFYLNQPGWGFIYLIFCWTFIPVILSVFEVLILLFTSDIEFQKRYSPQI